MGDPHGVFELDRERMIDVIAYIHYRGLEDGSDTTLAAATPRDLRRLWNAIQEATKKGRKKPRSGFAAEFDAHFAGEES